MDVCLKEEKFEQAMKMLQLPFPKSWLHTVAEPLQKLFGLHNPSDSKDILRTVITRELTSIDPLHSSVTFESYLVSLLSDTLVRYDQDKDQIVSHLAHHWESDRNGEVWTFYLRKGVRFHHMGFLTSKDVAHTFERLKNTVNPNRWLAHGLEKVECVSPYTIRFHLKNPNPFFLRYVSSNSTSILPCDVVFNEQDWIGTGPFRLKERSSSKLVIEAFNDYFLERPLLDQIEFWRVPKDKANIVNFQVEGESEFESPLVKGGVEAGFRFLIFNFHRETIVQNRSFRKAMYHLVDMKKMWKALGREGLVESSGFFPSKSKVVVKQIEEARRSLAESSYKGQLLNLYALSFQEAQEEAEWVKREGEKIGIEIKIHSFTLTDFYEKKIDDHADMIMLGEVSSIDHHLSFLGAFYNDSLLFRRMLAGVDLEVIEKQLDKFKSANDKLNREGMIDSIESYMNEHHLLIFQHHPLHKKTFSPMIHNIQLESFGYADLRKLWVKKVPDPL